MAVLLASPAVAAQTSSSPSMPLEISRVELQALLAKYEETAASGAYSAAQREKARKDATMIRERIQNGDFRLGDQVSLVVEGESTLSGDFLVQEGPSLVLPELGSLSLAGVLRAELEEHLRTELSRFIRDPVVRARSSIRLVVTGGVGNAGYYAMPTSMIFSESLMAAGGPSPDADLERIRVERGDEVIWEGSALQQAIVEGRTLDQLSIRAGDHIIVPTLDDRPTLLNIVRTTSTILGPLILLTVTLLQLF